MRARKLFNLLAFVVLLLTLMPAAVLGVALPAEPQAEPAPALAPRGDRGVESLSGSIVTFNPSAGGNSCYDPGATQTFCFDAHSYTADYEYVEAVWIKFPVDWAVTDVYVVGTPVCTGGGTWDTMSWSFETSPYEIVIHQWRYQSPTDDCLATYCVDVVAGTGLPSALESWYWTGDGYAGTPHHPCSANQYTPASMAGAPCDEWLQPQAGIPACNVPPGLYLSPQSQAASGCGSEPQEYTLELFNSTGSAGTFALDYSVPSGNGTLDGPATVDADQGEAVQFDVTLTDLCGALGDEVTGLIDASGNGYTVQSLVNKTIAEEATWETVADSAPPWAGYAAPRDGCTALDEDSEWVTYEIGELGGPMTGLWGYNHATNTWFQPGADNTPPNRNGPSWAYDPDTNLCYLTGGEASLPYALSTDAYVFDPVANSFASLGSMATSRFLHNSWIGTLGGVRYLCVGGGSNLSQAVLSSTQCYDLSQAAPGAWEVENAQIGDQPTALFGAADGVLHAPGGDQFWYVGGDLSEMPTDEAWYWDAADSAWHSAGNTGMPRMFVEGDFFDGEFYQVGGMSGQYQPTTTVVRATFDGAGWTWEITGPLNNPRGNNVVANTGDTLWSVDGLSEGGGLVSHGNHVADAPPDYVEKLAFCPDCGEPDIDVTPSDLSDTLCPDATDTINLTVCNVGSAPLTWSASESPDAPWLAEAPAGGTAQPGECTTVTVAFDSTGLAPAEYTGDLLITSDDPNEPSVTVPVTMAVLAPIGGAEFTWSPLTPAIGQTAYFTATVAAGEPPIAYSWDWGDGGTATGQYAQHAYAAAGAYAVTLTAANTCGQVTVVHMVTVAEPDIEITAPPLDTALCPDATDTISLTVCNVGGAPLTWSVSESPAVSWLAEAPASGTVQPGECVAVAVVFDSTALAPGDYQADLIVNSDDPDEPSITLPVTMTVLVPAEIGGVTYVANGLQVTFDATAVGEPPLSYAWSFGDGGTSNVEDPTYTYATGGCYTVTLDLTGACGTDTWTDQVCLYTPPGGADFYWLPVAPYADPYMGKTLYLTATVESGTPPFTFSWDWGDGTAPGSGQFPTHIYGNAGTYTITLTVGNAYGQVVVEHSIVVRRIYYSFNPIYWDHNEP